MAEGLEFFNNIESSIVITDTLSFQDQTADDENDEDKLKLISATTSEGMELRKSPSKITPTLLFPLHIGPVRTLSVQPIPAESIPVNHSFGKLDYTQYPIIKPLTQHTILSGGSDGRCRVNPSFLSEPVQLQYQCQSLS